MQFLVIIFVIAIVIAGIVFGILAAKKRREELRTLAAKLGLWYRAEKNLTLHKE